jgi:hypothetical protein
VTCPLISVTVSPTSPTVLLTASPNCPTASATPPTAPSLLVEVELPDPQSEDEVVELIAVESEMLVSQAAVEEEAQPPRSSDLRMSVDVWGAGAQLRGNERSKNGENSRQEVEEDELVPSLADSEAPEVPVRPVAAALLPVEPLAEESPVGTRPPRARLSSRITRGWRSLVIKV